MWWLSALLQPPWPDQRSSSRSIAIRSVCVLWISHWLLQWDGRIYLEKSDLIQIEPFFCFSQNISHRVLISDQFFSCLVLSTGSPMVIIASRPNVVFIVAWKTLNFKGRRDKERKQSPSTGFPDCCEGLVGPALRYTQVDEVSLCNDYLFLEK